MINKILEYLKAKKENKQDISDCVMTEKWETLPFLLYNIKVNQDPKERLASFERKL